MFKYFKNTKKQGDFGVGRAIGFFTEMGYTVSIPLTDSQEYDLIVDIEGILNKVQIKTSSYKKKYGIYNVNLSVKGGNRSKNKIKNFDGSLVDYLFIVTDDNKNYLIPTKNLKNGSTLNLGKEYQKYLV